MVFKSTVDKSTELCPELSLWILSPSLFNPYIMLMWLFITSKFWLPYLWRKYNSFWLYCCVRVTVYIKETETEREGDLIYFICQIMYNEVLWKQNCMHNLYMYWYIFIFSDILENLLKTAHIMRNLSSLQNICSHVIKKGSRMQIREMKYIDLFIATKLQQMEQHSLPTFSFSFCLC